MSGAASNSDFHFGVPSPEEGFYETTSSPEHVASPPHHQLLDPELCSDVDPHLGDDSDVVLGRPELAQQLNTNALGSDSTEVSGAAANNLLQSLIQAAYQDPSPMTEIAEPDPLVQGDFQMMQTKMEIQQEVDPLQQEDFQSQVFDLQHPVMTTVFCGQLSDYFAVEPEQQLPPVHIGEFQLDQNGSFDSTGMFGWYNNDDGQNSFTVSGFHAVDGGQDYPVFNLVADGDSGGFKLARFDQDASMPWQTLNSGDLIPSKSPEDRFHYATKSKPSSPSFNRSGSSQVHNSYFFRSD